ncbi:GNAT family N-acetyltransferase [Tumebacillus permanentifrigoris]|uniref:Phosphinothricin acetyltransferase n=1 Tax=Tumebacillus permanentifrigoris TaxID=378543 RepID=A0A316D235_9BACL|nr:GNAT family N-acetyltransferase [Tumebacillus permanentifrigoris]PWK03939.1 phosphinothricin acetyltransferase [Tumebacillus permanentifrigoris]
MVTIREARIEDLPALLAIYNRAVETTTATFDLEVQTYEQREVWFHKYDDQHPLIVAEQEGQIAGYGCLSKFRDKEAYRNSVENSVYIDERFQRQGIGKALLEDLLQRARQLGYHTVIAGITAGNDGSVKLHQAFGFELCGRFRQVGYKFDAWQDVEFYQLML